MPDPFTLEATALVNLGTAAANHASRVVFAGSNPSFARSATAGWVVVALRRVPWSFVPGFLVGVSGALLVGGAYRERLDDTRCRREHNVVAWRGQRYALGDMPRKGQATIAG